MNMLTEFLKTKLLLATKNLKTSKILWYTESITKYFTKDKRVPRNVDICVLYAHM